MELSVTRHNDYYIISCKNKIDSSILADNPDLITSKTDKAKHGKGLLIIKDVVNKYNGNFSFQENNGWFIVNIFLESSILPENA
jgi:sensor histidine kinase regulating citrate/malate metabolism